MEKQLETLMSDFSTSLNEVSNEAALKELESEYLGKKGKLKAILAGVKDLSIEDKKTIGVKANEMKKQFITDLEKKAVEIEIAVFAQIEADEAIDVTVGYPSENLGHKHPISHASELLEDIFISLGFKIEDGPQVESEEFAFDKLNIPADHPARDVWDTFWISDDINKDKDIGDRLLLRPHTSPVQIRTMLKGELPVKIIAPGRVFRYEQEDARHTCNFYQLEGLVVGEGVTFGDLKWTLDTVMKQLLGEKTQLRFRPSIFPFTEPSAEVDVSCQICSGTGEVKGKKCSMCSATGWVELLGAGMVHPNVLEWCGIDHKKYSGFAFGMGIDRIAAQRFGVSSSRMFYQNKLKLNEQF
ncbi:phenylalanine--tRNA ligase subunit alpha [Candidatus Gracilibacteria bacterium]|nr:phenylalanine--tRNA ligase subunit alpha [Candidatus Gracilibacteria bacterium]